MEFPAEQVLVRDHGYCLECDRPVVMCVSTITATFLEVARFLCRERQKCVRINISSFIIRSGSFVKPEATSLFWGVMRSRLAQLLRLAWVAVALNTIGFNGQSGS